MTLDRGPGGLDGLDHLGRRGLAHDSDLGTRKCDGEGEGGDGRREGVEDGWGRRDSHAEMSDGRAGEGGEEDGGEDKGGGGGATESSRRVFVEGRKAARISSTVDCEA